MLFQIISASSQLQYIDKQTNKPPAGKTTVLEKNTLTCIILKMLFYCFGHNSIFSLFPKFLSTMKLENDRKQHGWCLTHDLYILSTIFMCSECILNMFTCTPLRHLQYIMYKVVKHGIKVPHTVHTFKWPYYKFWHLGITEIT